MLFTRPLIKTAQSARTAVVITGPPSIRLSTMDKLIHAMFARNSLMKILPRVRQMSTISGPPSNPLPLPEKLVHGAVIAGAILAIPTWVLTHLSEYRGGSE